MNAEINAGRPRDARIDAAVLRAARDVLSEVGYVGLTLTEVAARAGTSVPALRRRWPGKVHLVHHVVFPTDVVMPPRDPRSTLDDEVRAIVDGCVMIFADSAIRQAVLGLISDLGPQIEVQRQLTDRLRDIVWPTVADRLRSAAARDGVEVDVDPTMVIEVAFGGALAAALIRGEEGLDDTWRDAMCRTLHVMIAAGV